MSKTIRDNAQQAALAMLANEVLYASCRYVNKESVASQKTYIFKVTGSVLAEIIARLEENRQALSEAAVTSTTFERSKITIESILESSSAAISQQPQIKKDNRILAVVESSSSGGYSIVEVIELASYLSLADMETPISTLRYLTGVINPENARIAKEREHQVIETIARKLQQQIGANYAISLLGTETYSQLVNELSIDNTEKLK